MTYSNGTFNLTATKLAYWHRNVIHTDKNCFVCEEDFEGIAEYLTNAGLEVLEQGSNFLRIAAVTGYRDEFGGRTDETDFLYNLITATSEEERKKIIKERPHFDKFNPKSEKTKWAASEEQIKYLQQLHKKVYGKELDITEEEDRFTISSKIAEHLKLIEKEQISNSKKIKQSFNRWLNGNLYRYLQENHYPFITFEEMTDDFFKMLHDVIKKVSKSEDTIWVKSNYDPTPIELKKSIESEMKKLQRKKPSEKQIGLFLKLCEQLSIDESIPDNYLLLSKKLADYSQKAYNLKPATEKQITTIKRLWKNYFNEDIELTNATQIDIQKYFKEIENKKISQ
ncbi:hypothetical protein [Metabacillus sp. B2-18]|uniref:hypothetical protein n=1 Tax=Metabacillus sp. B2-18 TaxID=2897333 RepID=UPI001E6076FA|nr:hypothetical protein [Metabacillus sp. B2-18]UGB30687.1 hypothetical protein LPC09_23820 [Metabacillus sp. B2-18]